MKHLLSICAGALALLLATPANADCQFGIKTGLNITSMKIKDVKFNTGAGAVADKIADQLAGNIQDPDNRCGFFIGPTVDFSLPIVGLGMETSLLYNQKVVEMEETKVKQNLLSWPINVKASVGLGDVIGIYGAIGPQFDFNIGDKNWKDLDMDEMKWKKTTVSLNLGFGVKAMKHIQAGLTYNIGLGNTAEYERDSKLSTATDLGMATIKNMNAKTNTWMFSVAYMF